MEEMIAHCRREYPNEACGTLAGIQGMATKAIPIRSIDPSPTFYEMDPAGQLKAQRAVRREGLEQMAVYHSHVATEALPSRRDVERATAVQDFFDGFYVIVTLKNSAPGARAFRIRDGHAAEEGIDVS